ncbi:MAG: ferredoxin--NADP reductase [Acidimicrobiia bacterium]|nr:ferredoxin--NADP reductase [Acidimicrobiia bacterium]
MVASISISEKVVIAARYPTREPKAAAGRDHVFHPLRIVRVVDETPEARSFVLEVPPEMADAFAYRAGQFVTHRVHIDDRPHLRCYSMSSSPDVGDEFQVTVKRVAGGVVSNWMIDNLRAGDAVETTCPAGVFCLPSGHGDVVAFAGGSGITPVFSIVKTALATTSRRVRLLYANRDGDSVIFATELERLAQRHPGRLTVAHHLDVEHGFVDEAAVRHFTGGSAEASESFICGPPPFMDIVERSLLDLGTDERRIHIERFHPAEARPAKAPPSGPETEMPARVTIELGGRIDTVDHRPGTTILQTARQMGMAAPSSCESGSCATCMAKLVEGTVSMFVNDALTDDELDEGWVLTCQSVPTSPSVHVVYEDA